MESRLNRKRFDRIRVKRLKTNEIRNINYRHVDQNRKASTGGSVAGKLVLPSRCPWGESHKVRLMDHIGRYFGPDLACDGWSSRLHSWIFRVRRQFTHTIIHTDWSEIFNHCFADLIIHCTLYIHCVVCIIPDVVCMISDVVCMIPDVVYILSDVCIMPHVVHLIFHAVYMHIYPRCYLHNTRCCCMA